MAEKPWTSHGHRSGGRISPEYVSWTHMLDRCYNPNHEAQQRYAERGITVCERWRGSGGFINFLADMGPRPEGMTLERENNDEGYCPENCTWATTANQNRNQTKTRWLTAQGRTQILSDWARELGMSASKLWKKLTKLSLEEILTQQLCKEKHS